MGSVATTIMLLLSSLPPMQRHARAAAIAAILPFAHAALAQSTADTTAAATAPSTTMQKVIITGNPLGSSDIAAPVSVLAGDELVLKRGSSLGDTLKGEPGVSTSYFGPNASRPIIRGMDGERVRMLTNAGASMDASTLSFDHAVPIDPLIIERLEVLRGPGALLYGGSGVVNAIDNRIPKQRLNGPSGALEMRLGGAESERGGAALAETGNSQYALHVDMFGRSTSDLRTPRYTPIEDGTPLPESTTVRNSFSRTQGGAIGGSMFFGSGYVGLSVDTYDSRYGTPAEADVHIDMKRNHVGLAFEAKDLGGPLRSLRGTFNNTDYQHQEVDSAGNVGTTFKTAGNELRMEAEHQRIGPLRGVVGLQWEDFDFAALGEEAFVPSTRTKRQALFGLEELAWFGGTLTGGLRLEHASVHSAGDEDPANPKFGAASERSFALHSASISNLYKLGAQWSVSGSLSLSERAPTSFELYANGLHAATAAFERGDPTLAKERGTNLDLALQYKAGADHLRVGVFATRFSHFISLEATGNSVPVTDDTGTTTNFAEFAFRDVRARMHGIEIEGQHRFVERPWTLDATGKLDLTHATNADTGEALPRVAPLRLLVGLDASQGEWGGRIEVDHAARQGRVPSTDTPTQGYTLVNASLTRRFTLGNSDGLWFLKLGNIGNTLAYSASTVQTVRDLSPLPGRSLKTGVRLNF
jgi:iron complex outermembrane receptor protein